MFSYVSHSYSLPMLFLFFLVYSYVSTRFSHFFSIFMPMFLLLFLFPLFFVFSANLEFLYFSYFSPTLWFSGFPGLALLSRT